MEQVDLPELKEEELRAYFQERAHESVGIPMSALNCPITRFYHEKYGVEVMATRQKISLHIPGTGSKYRKMKQWATTFTRLLDHKYRGCLSVTGEDALTVLDKALIEAKEMENKCQQPNPTMEI